MRQGRGSFAFGRVLIATVVAAMALMMFATAGGAGSSSSTTTTTGEVKAAVLPVPVGPVGYTSGVVFNGQPARCRFYRVALGNGVATEIQKEVPCVDGLTFSPSGVLYGYTFPLIAGGGPFVSNLVTIALNNGAQTIVGPMGRGFYEGGMTFDKDGKLWLYSEPTDDSCTTSTDCLYSVNPQTGATTVVGGDRSFAVTGLAADCSTVYATGYALKGIDSDGFYTVNTTNGDMTFVGDINLPIATEGLDFAADGTLYTIGAAIAKGPGIAPPLSGTINKSTGAGSNQVAWISDDLIPNQVTGLAIAGLNCAIPVPPAVIPAFTG